MTKKGWQYQGTFDEPRLTDVVETYREMGFEVRLEPFDPAFENGCTQCMQAAPDRFKSVFTRPVVPI